MASIRSIDILQQAIELLGPPVRIQEHRGWAIWWCPFHDDASKRGSTKRANFGINYASEYGHWKCLRCGAQGGGLGSLRKKMGTYTPPPVRTRVDNHNGAGIAALNEALSASRAVLRQSAAWAYIEKRGIKPQTTLIYGLGYGLSRPKVSSQVFQAAQDARMVSKKNWWLWAKGIVYAEPPTDPTAIQVRHLREKWKPGKYQTWGRQLKPYGSWRLSIKTETVISVEGMFDMLMIAQAIEERRLSPKVLAVYTGGSNPSAAMQGWYRENASRYRHILIPDADEAGWDWLAVLTAQLTRDGGQDYDSYFPPGNLDPDEAILAGWWPEGLK